jgi:hypothetical protein
MMRGLRGSLMLGVCLSTSLLGWELRAHAGEQQVAAIVPAIDAKVPPVEAKQLMMRLAVAVQQNDGVALMPAAKAAEQLPAPDDEWLRDCVADAACLTGLARTLGVRYALGVRFVREAGGGGALRGLHLVFVDTTDAAKSATDQLTGPSKEVLGAGINRAAQLVRTALRGGTPAPAVAAPVEPKPAAPAAAAVAAPPAGNTVEAAASPAAAAPAKPEPESRGTVTAEAPAAASRATAAPAEPSDESVLNAMLKQAKAARSAPPPSPSPAPAYAAPAPSAPAPSPAPTYGGNDSDIVVSLPETGIGLSVSQSLVGMLQVLSPIENAPKVTVLYLAEIGFSYRGRRVLVAPTLGFGKSSFTGKVTENARTTTYTGSSSAWRMGARFGVGDTSRSGGTYFLAFPSLMVWQAGSPTSQYKISVTEFGSDFGLGNAWSLSGGRIVGDFGLTIAHAAVRPGSKSPLSLAIYPSLSLTGSYSL